MLRKTKDLVHVSFSDEQQFQVTTDRFKAQVVHANGDVARA
jgi:hypothetical protein